MFKYLLIALLAVTSSVASAQTAVPVTGQEKYDIVCGDVYECFSDDQLKHIFAGKTVKYKHPRGVEFGVVTLTLNKDGTALVSNTKSGAGPSSWSVKEGKLLLNTREWKDFSFHVVRIGGVLFLAPFAHSGITVLVPCSLEG